MPKHYTGLSAEFDEALSSIAHYALYPEMMVAVGAHYRNAPLRVLVLGESHYFEIPEPSNTPEQWYSARDLQHPNAEKNISTRGVFNNVICKRKPCKSKAIYHALARALDACEMTAQGANSSLQSIAYMNYFQRPAEVSGESIRACARDGEEAERVIASVAAILEPNLVVFASRMGWRFAKRGLDERLKLAGIRTVNVPHPATSWWNRPSRPMGNKTGRERFIQALVEARASSRPRNETA